MAKKRDAHVIHDSCCNCRYWRRLDDSKQIPAADVLGKCLRYPPQVFGIDNATDEALQTLPLVEARHICGEHGRAVN
jgi:hypothetical protein